MSLRVQEEHEEHPVAVAIEGAVIVREYRRDYTHKVLYRQQCDDGGYVARGAPIPVSCEPYGTRMYGCYHGKSFVCPACSNRQAVSIQGGG